MMLSVLEQTFARSNISTQLAQPRVTGMSLTLNDEPAVFRTVQSVEKLAFG